MVGMVYAFADALWPIAAIDRFSPFKGMMCSYCQRFITSICRPAVDICTRVVVDKHENHTYNNSV